MPPMTGRSLQDAFSQMLAAEDGSDAAAGPRERRPLSQQPSSYAPSQASQVAPNSPQRQQEPVGKSAVASNHGVEPSSTASSSKQAFSSPWKASRQPTVQQGRQQHPLKDSGGGSQSSRSLRGAASAAALPSQPRSGEDGRRRPAVSISGTCGAAASAERRRRSAKRTEDGTGAGRPAPAAMTSPSSGTLAEAPEVRQLKQEVYAKDQEIMKLRAMCQEQASRLKNYEAYNSHEMEALKQRMEEFEQQLKAQGGTVGIPVSSAQSGPVAVPVSSGQSSWPPPAPFAAAEPGVGSGEGFQSAAQPSSARNDSVCLPSEAAAPPREGTTPRPAPTATGGGALRDESQAECQTSVPVPLHSACSGAASSELSYARQRARSSEAPEVRPQQWAATAVERPSPELVVASPRQTSQGVAAPKAAWQTMFSPRNSLRSANAAQHVAATPSASATALEPGSTMYRAASMSQMAPAVRTSLAACGSSRASLGGSVTAVRKVQAVAPATSGSRSRSPSGGPATPCASSSGHPVTVLPFGSSMGDAMQQYHRSSRATLPAAMSAGRPMTTWQVQDNQSGATSLASRSIHQSSAATLQPQQQQHQQFTPGPPGHCAAALSRR